MSPPASTGTEPRRPRSGRAAPLSAPERRAAIVEATIPLLRAHGTAVTTRQIAEAAGVAEGTIFSVFDDKDALVTAAVESVVDPGPTLDRLAEVAGGAPLEARLTAAVEILQAHLTGVWQFLSALTADGRSRPPARNDGTRVLRAEDLEMLFDTGSDDLRRPPVVAAQTLLSLTLGCSHPLLADRPLPAAEIVDLVLHGIRHVPCGHAPPATAGR